MQNKNSFLFFSLTGILASLFLSAAILPAAWAGPVGSAVNESRPDSVLSSQEQASSCIGLLMDAAAQAGVQGKPDNILDNISQNGEQFCSMTFIKMGSSIVLLVSILSERCQLQTHY